MSVPSAKLIQFPRSIERGSIEALLQLAEEGQLLSGFPRSIERGSIEALRPKRSQPGRKKFPRSIERGSIEAIIGNRKRRLIGKFPRSIERGSIEAFWPFEPGRGGVRRFHAQLSVAPLKLFLSTLLRAPDNRFHAQLSVAPLKHSVFSDASTEGRAFPRSIERGSIEALIDPSGFRFPRIVSTLN